MDELQHLGTTVTFGLRDSIPKFGNPVIDTFVSGLLVLISSWITTRLCSLLQTFPRICRGLSERCLEAFGYTENTVRLEGYITRTAHKTSQHFSNKFKAVLNHVSKLPYMDSKIKELVEVELEDDQRTYFVGQSYFKSFKIGDGLWCRFYRAPAKERGEHGETFVQENWDIEIYSRTKSLEEIELKIDQWETTFGFTENTIKLEGYITRTAHKTSQHFSSKFKAVLHHVAKLSYIDSKIKELVEIELEDDQRVYFVGQSHLKSFKIGDGLLCRFHRAPSKEQGGGSGQGETFVQENWEIEIFSRTKSLEEIELKIDQWETAYGFTENTVKLEGYITRTAHRTSQHFSSKFKAVLHQISKLPYMDSKIKDLVEVELEDNQRVYFVGQSYWKSFTIGDGLLCRCHRAPAKERGGGYGQGEAFVQENWEIEIFSRTKSLEEIELMIDQWEKAFKTSFRNQEIVLHGKIIKQKNGSGNNWEFSDRFFAVLHKISKLELGDTPAQLFELHLKEPGKSYAHCNDPQLPDHLKRDISRILPKKFQFCDQVDGAVEVHKIDQDDKYQDTYQYQIKITSATRTSKELVDLIKTWEKEYEDYRFSRKGLKYYSYAGPPTQEPGNSWEKRDGKEIPVEENFTEYSFNSGKTFDKLFCLEKDQVLKRVDFFTQNEALYGERGIPYTLGFLFHGVPGCGKTSTIQAIANHTSRHIINIPLKDMRNIQELRSILYGSSINKKPMPMHKRLFVIEDIDCNELREVVGKRESNSAAKNMEESDSPITESWKRSEKDCEDSESESMKDTNKKGRKKKSEKKSKLTLADLLEVFDGVLEMKGRMMVVTTNYPERLDAALTRPGRLDVKVEFKQSRREDVAAILKNFYGDLLDDQEILLKDLPDQVFTPAEVTQILLGNMDSPGHAIKELCQGLHVTA